MTNQAEELVGALARAFPPEAIDREMIDEPTSNWDAYEVRAELRSFEGTSWVDLPAGLLEQHSTLPVYAGRRLFHAVVPAYLAHVLRMDRRLDDLPFQLARQLTRRDDPEYHPKFDWRMALFSSSQREVVRDVLTHLATIPAIGDAMARAFTSWNDSTGA